MAPAGMTRVHARVASARARPRPLRAVTRARHHVEGLIEGGERRALRIVAERRQHGHGHQRNDLPQRPSRDPSNGRGAFVIENYNIAVKAAYKVQPSHSALQTLAANKRPMKGTMRTVDRTKMQSISNDYLIDEFDTFCDLIPNNKKKTVRPLVVPMWTQLLPTVRWASPNRSDPSRRARARAERCRGRRCRRR